MDTVLIIVAGVSLVLAAVMAALLFKVLRDERRRSDARVALLTELAAEPVAPAPIVAPRPRPAQVQRRSSPAALRVNDVSTRLDDLDLRAAPAPSTSGPELFQEHAEPSAWPRRVAVAAGIAAVLAGVMLGWNEFSDRTPSRQTEIAAAGDPRPLELHSLEHVASEGSLAISGIVQNPRAGATVPRLDAVVLIFGADGTLLTSGRAPIDAATLAPGAESRFVVRVPVNGVAARYRVSFRGENDQVIAHVDRRDRAAVARKDMP
jgi:hypothetical protein